MAERDSDVAQAAACCIPGLKLGLTGVSHAEQEARQFTTGSCVVEH